MKSSLLKQIIISLLAGIIPGMLLAGFMMYVAWQHNPQGEFFDYETGIIHWDSWLSIGFGWFVLCAVPVSIVVLLSILCVRIARFGVGKLSKRLENKQNV